MKKRCPWSEIHELHTAYHDKEWGVPVKDDRLLFEMLNLEGAQAGLNWITILKKREGYRKAFDFFDAEKIARYSEKKKTSLLKNEGIVRNRLKIHATVENAKAFLRAREEFGSFSKLIWGFVDGKTIPHKDRKRAIEVSERMSKELKRRGFCFVGPTICFAFMQAVGLVNDHSPDCFLFRG